MFVMKKLTNCMFLSYMYANVFLSIRQTVTLCNAEKIKIGIVGGGIGGTSASFFLRELFQDNIDIHLFEQSDEIGGRLATVEINGNHYESGGSIIHPKNLYMVQFLEKFNLKKRTGAEGTFGIFDGRQFVFSESEYNFVTVAKMFYRYGLDPYHIQKFIQQLLIRFSSVYDLQRNGYAFSNVGNLLSAMSPKFTERMRQNFSTTLLEDGYSKKFVDELVNAIVRVNYGQNTNVHGFVGAVAVAGAQPDLWAVHGGNKLIPKNLLDESKAVLHKCKVTSILHNTIDNRTVFCADENNNEETFSDFHVIVLAMPLMSDFKFVNFPEALKLNIFPYQKLSATFINGKLNERFRCDGCPSEILSCNDSLFFNSVGRNSPVDSNSTHSEKDQLWKVFSDEHLSVENKQYLFDEIFSIKNVDWLAYPKYEGNIFVPNDLKFEISDNLYHINVIEAAASAMEMSTIGAKNVALLIHNKHKNTLDKIDIVRQTVTEIKGDL